LTEKELISACLANNRQAQQQLFDQYSAKFFAVSMRYMKNEVDAEDVLVTGMFKVFKNLEKFRFQGSFEGWMRRIVVNEALMALRKRKMKFVDSDLEFHTEPVEPKIEHSLSENDILKVLDQLPNGYRTVFNLYVIEGYKHKEIAELLGISINTSKSQLILAKKKLRSIINLKEYT